MAGYNFRHSITSVILRLKLLTTAGAGQTGITSSTSGLKVGIIADVESTSTNYTTTNLETIATLGTWAAPTSGKVRIRNVDDAYHPGIVELHIADSRFSVANARSLIVTVSGVTGMLDTSVNIDLTNIPSNVRQIDQQDTNGNNATLFLKQLNVQNNAGDAVVMNSIGGNGNGLEIQGHGSGAGLRVIGGDTGAGATIIGGATSGTGVSISTVNGLALSVVGTGGSGLYVGSTTTSAVQVVAGTTGVNHGLRIIAGDQGNAIHAVAGTTTGFGLFLSGASGVFRPQIVSEIQSGLFLSASYTAPDNAGITAIKAKTDNLPSDPADASDIAASFGTVNTTLSVIAGYIDTEVAAIKSKTDNLPASPAAVGDIPSATTIANAVWDDTLSGHTISGSAGKIISDNVNATISSRASESSLTSVGGNVTSIKAKTDNLPSDPADASDISSSFVTVNSTLATIASYIDTEVSAIKTKTDNLPVDPADASDIDASFITVFSTLSAIAGYVDLEVAAIKAKTDNLPASPAATGDIPSVTAIANQVNTTLSTAHGSGSWEGGGGGGGGGTGSGAIETTVTIRTTSSDPISNAEVWITTDNEGVNIVAGTLYTDAFGNATFMLDAGTYYMWVQKPGVNFPVPQTLTVS